MNTGATALAAAVSFVVLLPFCGGGIDRRPIEDLASDAVTYQTEDGVRIVAGWFLPDETEPPAVILLHEQGGTRAQWNPLIGVLVDNGYAVLAPDLRGHGESDPYELTRPDEALLDVVAAIEWLKGRSEVDVNRTAVIGARFGADLAYVSTAVFPEVRCAVAMTPDPYNPEDPLLGAIPDFAAHDVFFMAGARSEWEAAATLGIRVQNVGGDRYEDHSDLDGVALLSIDGPIKDILNWFEECFNSPLPTADAG